MTEIADEIADDSEFAPFVAGFVQTLPLRLAALRAAEKDSNWKEVANLAHQMAGAAGGYGFPQLGEEASRVETLAKSHSRPGELARSIGVFDAICVGIMGTYPH